MKNFWFETIKGILIGGPIGYIIGHLAFILSVLLFSYCL